MEIRDRIKKILDLKKWSVYKLAKESDVAQSTLSDILTGKNKNPNYETLNKIADALGVFVDRLTGEAVSAIIEERIEELGVTLKQVAIKADVPLRWLQNIDVFIPGEMEDIVEYVESKEIGWNDTIIWPESYYWITKVAEVLGLPGSVLRAALARQEIPVHDGPSTTPEEDFKDINLDNNTIENTDNEIHTIAAHHDGEDWTEEELEDIENFKKYVLSKRKNGK
nr:MAG TPA: helix-turn-helix domain protein [Caudoviricetes sp.]